MDLSPPLGKLVDWLKQRKPELGEIDPDADLMKAGILDSLQFVNFLFVIEQVRGAPIAQEKVVPANFATLRVIEKTFL
jgi:acyl carrier protein